MFKDPILGMFLLGVLTGIVMQHLISHKVINDYKEKCSKALDSGEKIIKHYCSYYKNSYNTFIEQFEKNIKDGGSIIVDKTIFEREVKKEARRMTRKTKQKNIKINQKVSS